MGRVRMRAACLLLGAAWIGGCSAKPQPLTPAPAPGSLAAAGSKDDALLAANASMYVTFRPVASRAERTPLSVAIGPGMFPLKQMFGVDLRDANTLARLGVDE